MLTELGLQTLYHPNPLSKVQIMYSTLKVQIMNMRCKLIFLFRSMCLQNSLLKQLEINNLLDIKGPFTIQKFFGTARLKNIARIPRLHILFSAMLTTVK